MKRSAKDVFVPVRRMGREILAYPVAFAGVAGITLALAPLVPHRLNTTTVALVLLLAVLLTARLGGSRPAILASVFGVLCFNYFFIPPTGTFTIADSQNWLALGAFLITAITVGELSARARRRANEAEAGRREIERLYNELRGAFERASETEALRRSERMKSALLDAVTHDLRTPLTAIKASATTLLKDLDAPANAAANLGIEDRRDMLEVIDEETDRLNRFIEEMVELARLEAGAVLLDRRWSNIEDVVSSVLVRAASVLRRHAVELEFEPDLPLLRIDARAVAEVVFTLLDNAAKYSPEGARITVRVHRQGGDSVALAVEDEGPGVPEDLRERVFEKFFRGSLRPTPRAATGTGLGLAIARAIVEAHGGDIRIEDRADLRGMRIVFAIPIGDEDQADDRTDDRAGR